MVKPLEWTPMVPADEGQGQVDPEGKVWQELNTRQKKFVREYMKGQTATDAAMRAGYTKNRNAAKRQGSVLLNHNPMIRNYMIELQLANAERERVTTESHLGSLYDLRNAASEAGNHSAAVTAEVSRGKVAGLYIDRREVLTAQVHGLSKDALIERLGSLIKKRLPVVIDQVADHSTD